MKGSLKVVEKNEIRYIEYEKLVIWRMSNTRKSICGCVQCPNLVLNRIVITQNIGQIVLLLQSLNYLGHKFLETFMVRQDREWVPEQVLSPFTSGRNDSMKFY